MKTIKILFAAGFIFCLTGIFSQSCKSPETLSASSKDGSQLWSENCARCHNAPGRSVYTPEEWEVVGMHMRMRAHLTGEEARKIVEFLQ